MPSKQLEGKQFEKQKKQFFKKKQFFEKQFPLLWGVEHKLNLPGEIAQQIYHWQILPIIFEFSLRSHIPNEFPYVNKLLSSLSTDCFIVANDNFA